MSFVFERVQIYIISDMSPALRCDIYMTSQIYRHTACRLTCRRHFHQSLRIKECWFGVVFHAISSSKFERFRMLNKSLELTPPGFHLYYSNPLVIMYGVERQLWWIPFTIDTYTALPTGVLLATISASLTSLNVSASSVFFCSSIFSIIILLLSVRDSDLRLESWLYI